MVGRMWLVLLVLVACEPASAPPPDAGAPRSSATGLALMPPPPSVAEATADDPLAPFLRAAETDLREPWAESMPDALDRYHEASVRKPADGYPWDPLSLRAFIALTLQESDDPRVPAALVAWAAATRADAGRLAPVLLAMAHRPAAARAFASTAGDVFADERLDTPVEVAGDAPFSRLQLTPRALALVVAAHDRGGEGERLVRRVAKDRGLEAVRPGFDAYQCTPDPISAPDKHRYLAGSLRFVALTALEDVPLARRIAGDPAESAFFREAAKWLVDELEYVPYLEPATFCLPKCRDPAVFRSIFRSTFCYLPALCP